MNRKKWVSLCLAAALLCLLFAGCTASKVVKIGYADTETSHSWKGRFKSYNGYETKRISVPKDATALKLKFRLSAETGALRFTAYADGREIFDPEEIMEGTWELALNPGPGGPGAKYALRITGEQAKNGGFALEWEFDAAAE
jgi:hypothetical protein